MTVSITPQQLDNIFPSIHGTDSLVKFMTGLNSAIHNYGIDTPNRLAMFIAQTGHESGEYTTLEENLNYSAEALSKVFRKYFPSLVIAKQYARQPARIANKVYANRMGNGSEASGDGWKYRGRGLIQVTGKNNYEKLRQYFKLATLDDAIAFCSTPTGAVLSAVWYWNENNLNSFADTGDVKGATKAINGGYNGLDHRELLYLTALRELRK